MQFLGPARDPSLPELVLSTAGPRAQAWAFCQALSIRRRPRTSGSASRRARLAAKLGRPVRQEDHTWFMISGRPFLGPYGLLYLFHTYFITV